MANTVNLDIVQMAAAQAQKEVTFNTAIGIVDTFAGVSAVALVNGANTPAEAVLQAGVVALTGALTGAATVTVPVTIAKWTIFVNLTTGGQSVTVNSGAGSVILPYNCPQLVWPAAICISAVGSRSQFTAISVAVGGSTNVNLTDIQGAARSLTFTGVLTGNISVLLPSNYYGEWTVFNNTSGAFTLTVVTKTGTGIIVATGKRAILMSDGTNVVRITPDT